MIYRCPACANINANGHGKVSASVPCTSPHHDLYVAAANTVWMWDHWKHLLGPTQQHFVQKHMDNLKKAVDAANAS